LSRGPSQHSSEGSWGPNSRIGLLRVVNQCVKGVLSRGPGGKRKMGKVTGGKSLNCSEEGLRPPRNIGLKVMEKSVYFASKLWPGRKGPCQVEIEGVCNSHFWGGETRRQGLSSKQKQKKPVDHLPGGKKRPRAVGSEKKHKVQENFF